jgi:CheY-like chemotaxis protein
MPDGGTLSIDTANVSVTPGSSFEQLGVPAGDYVRLSVTDTGVGMDETTLAHAFDPFFTTKPAGEGTGLGLSTVYGVIRQSGGHVHAESGRGRGTTIRMLLPRVVADVAPPPAISQGPSGTGTILLVEDDGSVRDFMAAVLRRAGYTVVEAQSGVDALQAESRIEGPIDLLVSDVVMHGMNGKDLASRLIARRPAVAVLLISGYPKTELPLSSDDTFLQKPFGPDQFLMTISQVLDGTGRSAQSIHTSDGAHER